MQIFFATGFAQGQEAPKPSEPLKFYKLEFVLKEVEGAKVLNARSYSMTAATDARGTQSIRAGIRVPYQVGAYQKTTPRPSTSTCWPASSARTGWLR